VYHYEPENKVHSTVWKRPTSTLAMNFRSQPSAGKIMFTLFRDIEGAILVHFTPNSETVNKFPYIWPNERSSKRKKIFIWRRSRWRGAKLVKDATKKLFSDGIKETDL
jgi:hypothetical protein